MTSFSTDFHATLEETIGLIGKWMQEYPIAATAQAFPPSRLIPLTLANLSEVLAEPDVTQLILTEGPITRPAQSVYQALDEHPNGLCLNIGRLEAGTLTQSSLSTMDATPTWKKLNLELKKLTTAGATLDCANGLQGHDRNARFTAGAKALHASGVPLRQFANSTKFVYVPK